MNDDSYSYSSDSFDSSGSSSPDVPGFYVKVRYTQTSDSRKPVYAYALKAEVVDSLGVPDHLFVFQRSSEGTTGDSVDEFIQIASPLECEEVPENAPKPDEGMPYYRASSVTLWFRCTDDRELAKEKIDDDIGTLVNTYKVMNGMLEVQEEKIYE